MKRERQPAALRHSSQCSVCRSPYREEIERDFLNWHSPTKIAREFHLGSRQTIYRHARALHLFDRRASDARGILKAIIEQGFAGGIKPSPRTVLGAAVALAKLDDTSGKIVERYELLDRDTEFLQDPRWTRGERKAFVESGLLPPWAARGIDQKRLN